MPVLSTTDGTKIWQRRTSRAEWLHFLGWASLVLTVVMAWRVMTQDTIWAFVLDAPRQASDIASRMLPPRWSYLDALWKPLWDTLNMATLGTLLAIVMAVPIAFLAARNTTPSMAVVRPAALLIIVSSRSINAIIWALVLVTILGPGVLAGIFAIAFRSIGFIAKLLYEAIEEISSEPVEAIRATGASPPQVLAWGVWPQITPAFAGICVFRWDINIREATVLGLVGAGGIGLNLESSMNVLAWPQVTLILIVILVTVVISEWISARIRHAII
ncbi:MAG: phosphonate ABC transporter, permease protein PhnE [Hyphomicrobium sp. SCN 65-11]|nr:MAG: phosphonate ABC transporter, permease protein PhnE [Hyphomicrobium sp. SCN 65-11]